MKLNIKQEKGITMTTLVITVIMLIIFTNVMIYNTKSSININKLTNLYNDIELLRDKVSTYYDEYGKIPAKIEYTNTSGLLDVLSTKNEIGNKFYVIDLEAMQGITLNYGKDYEIVKDGKVDPNNYTDLYIINENSHNIFYVKGIEIKEDDVVKKYYTDYTYPDETTINLRYIDGILIPDGYYYIGKTKDANENESIVISNVPEDIVDLSKNYQYVWITQSSEIGKKPSDITLEDNQQEYQFVKSVNTNKGYFKNTAGKVQYTIIDEEKWSDPYTKETEYEDINGNKVTIPQGFRISMAPSMNTVAKGLVVKDSNNNEWVWVEVPKTVFITARKSDEYDKIKADLIAYASDYREGAEGQGLDWKDEWYAMDGDTLITASTAGLTNKQKALNNGCGLTYNQYQEVYQKMLSSVYTNGGFWISRYEIGDSTATASNTTRTDSSGTTGTAVSKANQIPYNYVTCSQAQNLANGMSTDSNKTISLLFGIQWDLTCKFIEINSNLKKADIKSNSTSWGNYKNSSLTLYRGKYNTEPWGTTGGEWQSYTTDTTNHVTDLQTSNDENYYQLLTTGTSEQINKMNIYDFAGNGWEWTLEHGTLVTNRPCVMRGGGCADGGSDYPASYRDNFANNCYGNINFRSALY